MENSYFLENATLLSKGGHVAVLELLLQFLGIGMSLPKAQKVWEWSCLLFGLLGIVCPAILADEIVSVTRYKRKAIMLASSTILN